MMPMRPIRRWRAADERDAEQNRPATTKQLAYLWALGVRPMLPMTTGKASWLIDQAKAKAPPRPAPGWFTVTDAWLAAHGTGGNAWTKAQLAALGIAWPPAHGWRRRVVGTQITEAKRVQFEEGRMIRVPRKPRKRGGKW
jgi:hypothetical protein